jgi:2-polyprenyl-3-methyl-5-hydroxy-6-metoxy-1,4-benzoquinol methylase
LPASGDALYEQLYEESRLDEIPDIVRTRTTEIVGTFDPWRGNGRLLDVGCGVGHVLEAAVRAGWRPEGVEIAESSVRHLGSRGFTVRRGLLHEIGYPSDLFDVVVASEVIEHVHDTDAFVSECSRVLRPGGLFYATTPNGAGCSARLLGRRWSTVAPPDHLQLFTARGIRALLDRHSLTTRKLLTEGFNPYEVIARVRGTTDEFDRVGSARALNASLSATRGRRLVKSTINTALSATRLGDGIKVYSEKYHVAQ